MDVRLFGEVFVTLFVITDPPGMLPIFLALTRTMPKPERRRAAFMAVGLAVLVIVVFAVAGRQILSYLGIGLPALQGAGGLLLLLVALDLLTGKTDDPQRQTTSNVALVPIGTPLLAGPGAIVATMLFVQDASSTRAYLSVGAGIFLVFLVTLLMLLLSGVIMRVLRPAGIEVLTRISGLLLAAIAVQLVADAVYAFVRGYSG